MYEEDNADKKSKKFSELFNNKKIQYIFIAVISIVILLLICGNFYTEKKADNVNDEIEIYVAELESKLSELLSTVEGAGKTKVVITVGSGRETVLAMTKTVKETPNGTETTETPLLINGKTVVLMEKYPKVTGVVIVSEGAKNIMVMNKLQKATISLLNVNINQIEIFEMK